MNTVHCNELNGNLTINIGAIKSFTSGFFFAANECVAIYTPRKQIFIKLKVYIISIVFV